MRHEEILSDIENANFLLWLSIPIIVYLSYVPRTLCSENLMVNDNGKNVPLCRLLYSSTKSMVCSSFLNTLHFSILTVLEYIMLSTF